MRPRKAQSLLLALLLGLVAGVGLVFLVDYLDTSLKTLEDVKRALGLPTLGLVPPLAGRPSGHGKKKREVPRELLLLENPRSPAAESFRSIRTSLMFSRAGRRLGSFLVTSTLPQEGKTTVSVNIAAALAQAGKRVLLVDADLRRPRIHGILGIENEAGLSNLLSGEEAPSLEAVIHETPVQNLKVLTSGPLPPNPAELLGSEEMKELAGRLAAMFDQVVIDTPPLLNATDAAVAAQYTDGVVLVIRSFRTDEHLARRARDMLAEARVRILGAVLNNADVPVNGYAGRYYRYGYGYGAYGDPAAEAIRRGGGRKDPAVRGTEGSEPPRGGRRDGE